VVDWHPFERVLLRLRAALPNAVLSLVTIALFGGGAEGLCRLLERRHGGPSVEPYITDWTIWDGDFYTVDTAAAGWPPLDDYNADGLRDRAHALSKPAGVARLIVLGDSVTAGYRVRPAEAYPQLLQERLDALSGGRFEVFNVALGGWSTRQERIAYQRLARKYRPDHVLLGVCLNDIPELGNNLGRPAPWLARLHGSSALVRRVVRAADREIRSIEELTHQPESRQVRSAYQRFFAEVRSLRAEVERDGARLSVLVFPFAFQIQPEAPEPAPQNRIAAFCASEGLRCLDLLPAMRHAGPAAFVDYDHFSPAGSRVVAEEILAAGLLPGLGGYHGRDDPGADLTARLRDRDPRVRASAAWALGRAGGRAARHAPALLPALGDTDAHTRAGAAWALGRMGPAARPAGPYLLASLRDQDPEARRRAADALSAVGLGAALVPALVAIVEDERAPGRAEAARVVGALGTGARHAGPALARALDAAEPEVRREALAALRTLGPAAESVPALLRALHDPALRWRVPDVLGELGPAAREAVPALTEALADANAAVRWRAAKALGRIGPAARKAAPLLATLTRDPQGNVRAAAVTALVRVEPDLGLSLPALRAALGDAEGQVRVKASDAIGALGPAARDAVPSLLPLLEDSDVWVRAAAARAVKRVSTSHARHRTPPKRRP
jgi:HEAT repeat protein/lysophospholipase L1-like esterase